MQEGGQMGSSLLYPAGIITTCNVWRILYVPELALYLRSFMRSLRGLFEGINVQLDAFSNIKSKLDSDFELNLLIIFSTISTIRKKTANLAVDVSYHCKFTLTC